jgi:RIO kinase 1
MHDYSDDYLDDSELDYSIYVKEKPKARYTDRPPRRRSAAMMRAEVTAREQSLLRRGIETVEVKAAADPSKTLSRLVEEDRDRGGFEPTIAAVADSNNHVSYHEREWILTYLGVFYEDQIITDVVRRVKGGKEATVYFCRGDLERAGSELVAGKVYHERMFRKLSNDMIYREGRDLRDESGKQIKGAKERKAMSKGTGFGQTLRHSNWLFNEWATLNTLHKAGADVPRPIANSDNALLMEYVGDEELAAPALVNVSLPRDEVKPTFDRIVENIGLMLELDLVHADLSAHNILYWDGKPTIIDFPQAVNVWKNPHAFALYERDVQRICDYFARYGLHRDGRALARQIWVSRIPT